MKWCIAFLVAFSCLVNTAMAQFAAKVTDDEPDPIDLELLEIDVNAMIERDITTLKITNDPIFNLNVPNQVAGGFGGQNTFIKIPLLLKPSKEGKIFKLDSTTLAMKGGKLVCFQLESLHENDLKPNAPPRMSKELYILPNGNIRWKITKLLSIKHSTLRGTGQFRDKLDIKFLMKKRPKKPSGSFAQKRAGLEKLKEFMAYQKKIRELPKLLESKMPERVWAIFDFSIKKNDMTIVGPKGFEWPITYLEFQDIKKLLDPINIKEFPVGIDGQPDKSQFPPKRKEQLQNILKVLEDKPHPYNVKLIATAFSGSKLFSYCSNASEIATLSKILVRRGDAADRARVGKAVATTFPPNLCIIDLLKSLKPLLNEESIEAIEDEQLKKPDNWENKSQVNRYIQEHITRLNDPESTMAVHTIMDAMVDMTTKHVKTPETIKKVAFDMPISKLPAEKRSKMIAYLLARGGSSNLTALMVNERIFGASDPVIIEEALTQLQTATIVAKNTEVPNPKALKLSSYLFLHTSKHQYFKLLKSDNEKIRNMAWKGLAHFACLPGIEANQEGDRFDTLVQLALLSQPTPPQIISFLSKQVHKSHQGRVIESLLTLIQRGDSNTKILAARTIVGQPGPLDKALIGMPYEERFAFIKKLYQANDRSMPLVAGLLKLRSPSNPVLLWFASKISNGEFPVVKEWAPIYEKDEAKRDRSLVSLIGLGDETLDRAALSALTAEAGGEDKMVEAIYEKWKTAVLKTTKKVKQKNGKTTEVVKETKIFGNVDAMLKQWAIERQSIFRKRLMAFQGEYRMRVRTSKTNTYVIKAMLKVTDEEIVFGETGLNIIIPDGEFGLILDKPEQLNNIDHPLVKEIPFENAFREVDLKPFEKDFVGRIPLGAAGTVEIWFEPVKN